MPINIRINNRAVSTLQVGEVIAQSAYYGQSFVFITAFDPDAATYIEAVEAADEQTLEAGVKLAIDVFVTGCKADGIWDAIKVSCILAGARTLNGALVPLAGDAPTNFNFVSADYDRVTGLKGDASTKYLDSNRSNAADPQDNNHNAVFVSEFSSDTGIHLGTKSGVSGPNGLFFTAGRHSGHSRRNPSTSSIIDPASLGFLAITRSSPSGWLIRNSSELTVSDSSQEPTPENVLLFARKSSSDNLEFISDGRLTFYSVGESTDLAALDARLTTLMTEIEGALT